MKRILLPLVTLVLALTSQTGNAQCTPVNCLGSLPAYGGICDTMLLTGRVNVPYNNGNGDFESFVITSSCFDAGLISPSNAGTNVRISNVDNFTYTLLPAGITATANQNSYSPPNPGNIAGCVRFLGTPTQIGVFTPTVNFLADVIVCGFPLPVNNNAASYPLNMVVLPDPAFTGLASTYCTTDATVNLTVTGTTGGTFTGPGITGSTFNPATAGAGTHTIKYKVSRQEGSAIAAATDSMMVTVTVSAPGFTYYLDNDNDGFGQNSSTVSSCSSTAPAGYASVGADCDDANELVNPSRPEVCNGIDDNCNGNNDDGLTTTTYYADNDDDGFGNAAFPLVSCLDAAPSGYANNDGDCDDNNNAINPNALEIPNNNVDENCDGNLGVVDTDNDGFNSDVDCDDNNNTVYPGAPELCDGLDNNCVGGVDEGLTFTTYYLDGDNDGYGSTISISSCSVIAPNGYVTNNTDCNDNDSNINPGATEVCDGIDNDCAGGIDNGLTLFTYYQDNDNDTYGDSNFPITTCSTTAPNGYAVAQADCDDGNPAINPGAIEICDGIDNNCSGSTDEGLTLITYYLDFDNDGFGNTAVDSATCSQTPPLGYILVGGDCDDANNSVYPNAPETCDGVDNDCINGIDDGIATITYYRDFDADNYGDPMDSLQTCSNIAPAGYVTDNTDCDDTNTNVHPNTLEVPNNGIDEDCVGGDLVIGLNNIEAEFGIKVFPNPAQNYVTILGNLTDNLSIAVYDLQGKQMFTQAMVTGSNFSLDITALNPGCYMLEVNNKVTHARAFTRIIVVK